jgi:NAD(P)-dependent dehydrogenase (short-subunit alcohol dehydrogenase family)
MSSLSPSDLLLTDQVALVTGGGAGIGQGIAAGLARFGADVVVAEVDPERAASTVALVEAAGRQAIAPTTDVTDPDQVQAVVDAAMERFGRLDILVNNAGGVRGQRFLDQSPRSRQRHVDLNLNSMFLATAAVVPHMIAGGRGGTILNVSSIEGTRAAPTFAVYAACKAGMNSFTRTMAVELAEHAITVNALLPDMTATPGSHGLMSGMAAEGLPARTAAQDEGVRSYIPLGREGHVDEVAGAAVFLASSLGRYITGVALPVDGGTWASSGWTKTPAGGWGLFRPWFTELDE